MTVFASAGNWPRARNLELLRASGLEQKRLFACRHQAVREEGLAPAGVGPQPVDEADSQRRDARRGRPRAEHRVQLWED